ncbi:hypothetical protein CHAB381_0443 [Campylobacter hominis ATCC BAA-381]|uniref:Uncharacterized protein n=1 Tax=Campylobacter hominis (strain ATCC BAA-381 / DSM 21671 / CCUG 45161 / LMG 19568 / NCTC 13146 / CH001A) TaxID=360107 RepID=A7I0J8_CAMHC|nr:hypothetical protein CHAB381_0443 [Campylobacter hominis ATCC BAA-381]
MLFYVLQELSYAKNKTFYKFLYLSFFLFKPKNLKYTYFKL